MPCMLAALQHGLWLPWTRHIGTLGTSPLFRCSHQQRVQPAQNRIMFLCSLQHPDSHQAQAVKGIMQAALIWQQGRPGPGHQQAGKGAFTWPGGCA